MKALAVKNTSHESQGGNHKPAKKAQLAVNKRVAAFPGSVPYIQPKSICPCDGGCPRCVNEGVIQPKLTLGQPNDKYEQEADRVADQVVNLPEISTIACQDSGSRPETVPTTPLANQITPFVRREPIEEEDEKEKEPVQAKLLPFPIQKQAQAEIEEETEEEEEQEEEQVQAGLQRMAGGREEIQPKGLKENGGTAGGNFKARLAAGQGAGQTLPAGVLSYMAARLGTDFSGVRVHTDSPAVQMSAELKARAFTYGSDIYFNQGNYDPASSQGLWLLTHELTHVMQQGKAGPQPTAKVQKSIEKEAEEEKELEVQAKAQTASISSAPPGIQRSFLDSVTGAAGAVWDATAGQLIDAAGEVIEMTSEFFWGLLETIAPAFAPIVREIADKGILGFLKDKISPALNHLFDGLNDNSTLLGPLLGTYMEMAAQAGEIVIALASGDCQPLFAAVNRLKDTLSKMAGDAWNAITDFFAPVGAFFSDMWQSFGAPVLDWLGQTATDVWNEISGFGQQIWAWTQPFREEVGGAWDWVKGKLGIGGQEAEGDSEGGLVQWIQAKAEEAWSIIKEELQPVIEPIQAVVEKVEAILPLDAIFNLRETIQGWLSKAEAMGQAMGEDGSNVAEQQTSLRDEILPAILVFIDSLRANLIGAGLWISEKIGAIVDTVSGFINALMSLSLVSGLQAAVMWIQTALLQLADWYRTSVVAVFNLVGDGLVTLSSFIRPILDILNQIVETLKNLMGKLPDLILGPVWWLLPACIKNPIKDFILNQILLRIPFFQDFLALGDLWQKFKATAMTILKQIFVDGDILGALWTYFKAILGIFGLPPQLITNIIVKAAQALGDILANPIGFIINILKAVKEGFVRFFANILKHLMGGVTDWLFGQIAEAGITLPQDFSLKSILGLVFQILGLTMEKIWQKLAAKIGPDKVEKLKTGINLATGAWEWVKLAATEEPAAIWDKLKEKLSDLWTTVITGVVTWVNSVIIVQGTKWLLSFLDVSGIMPTITATIALYKAVESFFEYLKEMLEIVNTVFNGIADIAKGAIGTAAGFLESALANSVPIIIGFLANQFGLGRLGNRLREIIGGIQEKVDGAIEWLIEKAVNTGKAFLEMLKSGAAAVKEGIAGLFEWWKVKKEFQHAGESHTLLFEGKGPRAQIVMQSRKHQLDEYYEKILTTYKTKMQGTPKPNNAIQTAVKELGVKLKEFNDLKNKGLSHKEGTPVYFQWNEEFGEKVGELSSDITGHLAVIPADYISGAANDVLARPKSTKIRYPDSPHPTHKWEASNDDTGVPGYDASHRDPIGQLRGDSIDGKKAVIDTLSFDLGPNKGSRGISKSSLMKAMKRFRGIDVTPGHLINHQLGGPGDSELNIAPITKSCNTNMDNQFESKAKELVIKNNEVIRYEVEVEWDGHPDTHDNTYRIDTLMPTVMIGTITVKKFKKEDDPGLNPDQARSERLIATNWEDDLGNTKNLTDERTPNLTYTSAPGERESTVSLSKIKLLKILQKSEKMLNLVELHDIAEFEPGRAINELIVGGLVESEDSESTDPEHLGRTGLRKKFSINADGLRHLLSKTPDEIENDNKLKALESIRSKSKTAIEIADDVGVDRASVSRYMSGPLNAYVDKVAIVSAMVITDAGVDALEGIETTSE